MSLKSALAAATLALPLLMGGCAAAKRMAYGPTACLPDRGEAIVQLWLGDEKFGLPLPASRLAHNAVLDAMGTEAEVLTSSEPLRKFGDKADCVTSAIARPAKDRSAFFHISWNAKVNNDVVGYAYAYVRHSSTDAQNLQMIVKLAK